MLTPEETALSRAPVIRAASTSEVALFPSLLSPLNRALLQPPSMVLLGHQPRFGERARLGYRPPISRAARASLPPI
jgi:hypothetical protein